MQQLQQFPLLLWLLREDAPGSLEIPNTRSTATPLPYDTIALDSFALAVMDLGRPDSNVLPRITAR